MITVASEVMAVLALASDLADLRARLGPDGPGHDARRPARSPPRTCKVAGAMAVLLKDAIKPNLLQTLEGGPAFVHCGPFANIAHGNNSVLADRIALATNEIVCTEAGFGADMGAEKFFDIKCRASGLRPDAAVVVATIRALKMHGGVGRIVAGKPLDPALLAENVDGGHGRRREPRQADRERAPVQRAGRRRDQLVPDRHAGRGRGGPRGRARGRRPRRRSSPNHWAKGGEGAADLADRGLGRRRGGRARLQAPLPGRRLAHLEDRDDRDPGLRRRRRRPQRRRREAARAVRGARLRQAADLHGQEPVLAQPRRGAQGPPDRASALPIREVRLSAGAGFVTPLAGEMRTMPGLPSRPGGENIDLDADGEIVGLF